MKHTRNPMFEAVRFGLVAGIVTGAGAGYTGVAVAQDDAEELERIQVTGSRIKRTDIEGAAPVLVLDREALEATGLQSVGDILQNLPSAGSALNTTFNNGGNGETQIDLRNLGAARVLVLVNGRRWAPGIAGAVDLNNIPAAVIERIEVLKDGASAIYGSDAIAGVVNIITRKNVEGAHASAYYGEYASDGDGETEAFDFGIGGVSDRASAYINFSYVNQDGVLAGDREISAVPVFGAPEGFGGSSGTPQGRFFFLNPEIGGFNDLTQDPGNNGARDGFRPWTQADAYNFAPNNWLLTPQERKSVYAQATYEVSNDILFRTEFMYNNRRSNQLLAATPLFIGNIAGGGGGDIGIDATNVFNPFGFDLGPADAFIGRRMNEVGPRLFAQDVHSYNFNAGFQGGFEAMGRFFDWDVNFIHQDIRRNDSTDGLLNLQRVERALGPAANCQGPEIDGCVPLNLFGGGPQSSLDSGGSITQEMVDYIAFTAQSSLGSRLNSYTANLTGDLFELPAGMAQFAVGYEYRRQSGFDQPDALIVAGITSGNAREATSGGFSSDEFYGEVILPLLSGAPFAEVLELSGAIRYSDYSNFGSSTTGKVGLRWQPIQEVLIRSTYSEGFRAPSVFDLFQGQSDSFPGLLDPCSDFLGQSGSDTVGGRDAAQSQEIIDNCIADGVPSDGSYQQFNSQIRITVGGEPSLSPEESESYTFGVVWSPDFIEGFDVTADWYNIELTNAISAVGSADILDACYESRVLCERVQRGSGGVIADILATGTNIGGQEVQGVDFLVRYRLPETDFGVFNVEWSSSYVDENTQIVEDVVTGAVEEIQQAGLAGDRIVLPRWRSNARLNWNMGDWEANWIMRYVHATVESCTGVPSDLCSDPNRRTENGSAPRNRLGGTVYHDLQLSYHLSDWNTRVTVGAVNAFDRDPPISYATFANSFDPTMYDIPGIAPYLRVSTQF